MWKFAPVFIQNRNPNAPLPQPTLHGSNPALCENRGSGQFGTYYPSVAHQSASATDLASDPLTQCVATFYWLAILIFISIPVSLLAIVFYVIVSPLATCFSLCLVVNDFLLKVAHFPTLCAKNLVQAKNPGCFF